MMSVALVDCQEELESLRTDQSVILCGSLKEFGGGVSPSYLLLEQACERGFPDMWIVVREQPQRPCQVNWNRVKKNVVQTAGCIRRLNPAAKVKLICPVPLSNEGKLLAEPIDLPSGVELWADPSVYLVSDDQWKELAEVFAGVCYPMVGLTEEEMLDTLKRGYELAARWNLQVLCVPYKTSNVGANLISEVERVNHKLLTRAAATKPSDARGELMAFQEHELVTNLFALPLKTRY